MRLQVPEQHLSACAGVFKLETLRLEQNEIVSAQVTLHHGLGRRLMPFWKLGMMHDGMTMLASTMILGMQEVRALSLLDALATLTLAGNPLLERLGPRAVDVLVRNACPAVVSLDGRELGGGRRGVKKPDAAAPLSVEVHNIKDSLCAHFCFMLVMHA